jgi:hypothetical protein
MKIGTRSILFGVHQFALHPLMVAAAWFKLYGFSRQRIGSEMRIRRAARDGGFARITSREVYASILHPRLWLAFLVHDIGYWGSPNMDGDEGELHPQVGARIMRRVTGSEAWETFVLYHSRFLAKRHQQTPSTLCIADKLAIVLPPRWLYLRFARLSGEVHEYMAKSDRNNATGAKYAAAHPTVTDMRSWHNDMVKYVRAWVAEHRDGRADTWTPAPDAEMRYPVQGGRDVR